MLIMIQKFFTIPYQWTFDLIGIKAILFSLYMWLTFGIPTLLGYIICSALILAQVDGKDESIMKIIKYTLIIMLVSTIQFFIVLGIGNIITIK